MALAIFDLDNTLIAGDSDHAWGQFASTLGLVDATEFRAANDRFHADYQRGELNIDAYLRFALSPLVGQSPQQLAQWHAEFMQRYVQDMMLPRAAELIQRHRSSGDHLLIITATNEFVTRPIASALGIEDLIACQGKKVDGRYTGEPLGTPSYAEGKVTRLQQWLVGRELSMEQAWFYSDSHNDLPLLKKVGRPVAVDPDLRLRAQADARGWPIISLRD